MKHLTYFHNFNEDLLIQDIIDSIKLTINESSQSNSIWDKIVMKLDGLSESGKKKLIRWGIGALLALNTFSNISQIINSSNAKESDKKIAIEIVKEESKKITKSKITKKDEDEDDEVYKCGWDFKLSDSGWDHIKKSEGFKLKAYDIGDGKITVGYGHAEDIGKTDLKVGQKITKQEAEKYLRQDLKIASDGVRKIFKEWRKEGHEVKITQNMFDALVSLAYNAGIGSLRQSRLIQHLKKGKYKKAAHSIKSFNVSKKFPGLTSRREKESEMFSAPA